MLNVLGFFFDLCKHIFLTLSATTFFSQALKNMLPSDVRVL